MVALQRGYHIAIKDVFEDYWSLSDLMGWRYTVLCRESQIHQLAPSRCLWVTVEYIGDFHFLHIFIVFKFSGEMCFFFPWSWSIRQIEFYFTIQNTNILYLWDSPSWTWPNSWDIITRLLFSDIKFWGSCLCTDRPGTACISIMLNLTCHH